MKKTKDVPWKEAIVQVLQDAGEAMSRSEIAEAIVAKKLRTSVGATPANTVVSYISSSIASEGESSPFIRVGRGEYALRSMTETPVQSAQEKMFEASEEQSGGIKAFGIYWSRDLVLWKSKPMLLGQQQLGASSVDMSQQIGIYLLYDEREVIYVGRSTDRPLGQRLFEHTQDRLRARWNRFSWFGLYGVTEKGKLAHESHPIAPHDLVRTLEAALIESLEPRQNRKRGDDFAGIEYIQTPDPKIEESRKLSVLSELAGALKQSS